MADLKQPPLARPQQLALPAKPVQPNGGAASVGFEAYGLNNPMGTLTG